MDPEAKTRIGGYVGKYDDCEKVKRAVLSLCAIVDCEGSMDHELATLEPPLVKRILKMAVVMMLMLKMMTKIK